MKTETLEIIIEELSNSLSLEKWKNELHMETIRKLKDRIEELESDKNNGTI